MAEYETVQSFPVVDHARQAARNYGRSVLDGLSAVYEAMLSCFNDSIGYCIPSLRRNITYDTSYSWEDDTDARWSDELERLLDSEGQAGEDSTNALSKILTRLPFIRGSSIPYKPSAANLRRARTKSRSSIHSNGTGGTGDSLRSRADLFDHSGDEFEDAGMLPDESIYALTSENPEDTLPVSLLAIFANPKSLMDRQRLSCRKKIAWLNNVRKHFCRLNGKELKDWHLNEVYQSHWHQLNVQRVQDKEVYEMRSHSEEDVLLRYSHRYQMRFRFEDVLPQLVRSRLN